jgi:hypothetical protein
VADLSSLSELALWIVVLVQGSAMVEVIRQLADIRSSQRRQGALVTRGEGLEDGAIVPDLRRMPNLIGQSVAIGRGYKVVLFLTAACDLSPSHGQLCFSLCRR